MTLQQASKVLDISKKRLWRAVKSGHLDATRVQRGGRWEYRVNDQQLETYRRKYLDSLEMKAINWSEPSQSIESGERSVPEPTETVPSFVERPVPSTERSLEDNSGLHGALVERLAQAERRIVELEYELEESKKNTLQISHAVAIIKEANRREQQLAKLAQVLAQLKSEVCSH